MTRIRATPRVGARGRGLRPCALLALLVSMLAILPASAFDAGRFDAPVLAGVEAVPEPWQLVRIDSKVPPTRYRLRGWEGVAAIEARAEGSMALLARPLPPSIAETPVLCWRWRVEGMLQAADLNTRRGDDYAARVYVAFDLPPEAMDFATRARLRLGRTLYGDLLPDAALNYVWDNRQPVGTRRPNAYTDRALMWVLRSGSALQGQWVQERRDVMADVVLAFGSDKARPRLLAVAADTDNTGERVTSGFADLHFVARDAPCRFAGPVAPAAAVRSAAP